MKKDVIDLDVARTLDGLFRERVRRSPGAPAYVGFDKGAKTWRQVTWGEAGDEVSRWQAALAGEGLQPGDRVALALKNCKEWVYFDQAALGLGLVVVPLYPDDRPDNVAYILQDAGVKVLLLPDAAAWRRLSPHAQGLDSLERVLLLGVRGPTDEGLEEERVSQVAGWLPATSDGPAERAGDPHALCSIVYTSGTTGRPKGVMLSHHNILSVAHAALGTVDCYQEDLFLSFLPLSHTLERTGGYYLPMMTGSAVAYARSIAQLAEDLATVRPTVLIAVPRIFERFYARVEQQISKQSPLTRRLFGTASDLGWRRFEYRQGRGNWTPALLLWPLLERLVARKVVDRLGGRLRVAVSGGAALSTPVARMFIGLGLPLLQGYGLTETSPVISVNKLEDNDPASVGLPLPGIEVRIGEDEELLVKGPGVMLGYWGNQEATKAIIDEEGWLHTGDQARLQDGHVYITGRLKDILVLSNGEKVPPGDMEGAITLDELFDQAMVIGEGQPFLGALVVLNPERWPGLAREHGLDPDDAASLEDSRINGAIVSRISGRLKDFPGYAKIRRAVVSLAPWTVDNGLLTPTLKVKRNKVLEHYAGQIARIYEEGPAGSRRRVA